MELPCRECGDELLAPGELADIRNRLNQIASQHDIATVVACAFDHRTRMLPFIYADMKMVPAGVRAIGAAMLDSGFEKTRIVLQQWNKNFDPAAMQLDGRIPDIFMVSSMKIHSDPCEYLIRRACEIPESDRPLIIAGGPKCIYEPWSVFSADPDDPWGADVSITGEEYVTLSLLERLLNLRMDNEPIRQTFLRARDAGQLDDIPGLVFAPNSNNGVAVELVDTGIQRLLGNLDELPDPVPGYSILEKPSRKKTLSARPLPAKKVSKYCKIGSIVLTFGCKFNCPYCPIPAYNQKKIRFKSGQRIADEMIRLYRAYGLRYFFGADDNFFNNHERTKEILETLSKISVDGKPFRKTFRWGTEVTVHDALKMEKYLPLARKAGIRALWMGVEDMTGNLVKKGQDKDKTTEAFQMLCKKGIAPMPMMMHHDAQPLFTPGKMDGLLNQVRALRKAGAVSLQVLMITPATGSKLFEETYSSGMVYKSVAGKKVQPHMVDGNYVVASHNKKPWRNQLNILVAYMYFYNPLRFVKGIFFPKISSLYLADSGMQLFGMYGLTLTIRRTFGWMIRLMLGKIKRGYEVPQNKVPMRTPDGKPASHALKHNK